MIVPVSKNLARYVSKHTSSHLSFCLSLRFFSNAREDERPTLVDILLHKHHFSPQVASRVTSKLPNFKNPEKADSVLSFLKETGLSNTQLEKIFKYRPEFLRASLEITIKPKIKIFQDMGFSSKEISTIISTNPMILHLSADKNIIPSLSVLKGLLGSNYDVIRLVRSSSWFVSSNLENNIVPNLELFKSLGIPKDRVFLLLYNFPKIFMLKPQVLRRSVDKAEEMGIDRSSKVFIYAVRTIASMSNEYWERKLRAFLDLGFSESDISKMFIRQPPAFSGSMVKIKKIKELLLATGKFSMSCIVNIPVCLTCSIEKRYEPRLRILGILESRKLIKKWPSLRELCNLSDDKFFQKFILPYLDEIRDVYVCHQEFNSQRQKRDQMLTMPTEISSTKSSIG